MESLTKSIDSDITAIGQACSDVAEVAQTAIGVTHASASVNALSATANATTAQTSLQPTDGSTDDFLSCSVSVSTSQDNPEKLIYLASAEWGKTKVYADVLITATTPNCFLNDTSKPAWGQARYFRYLRTGYSFRLCVNAPPGSQGLVVVTWLPPGYEGWISSNNWATWVNTNSLLNLPYSMCDVRVTTEVTLNLPFINFKNYVNYSETDPWQAAGGRVVVWVMCPYNAGTSTSSAVTVSLYGEMIEPDFQCPRPYNSQGRKRHPKRRKPIPPPDPPKEPRFLINPGPGATNFGNAVVHQSSETTALVNEATSVDLATAGSRSPITDLKQVLNRWQLATTFNWTNQGVGAQIGSYVLSFVDLSSFSTIMDKFQWWRGSIQIKVLTIGTAFSTGRYQLSWYRKSTVNTLADVRNAYFVTSDLAAGSATLTVPFTNDSWRLSTSARYGTIFMHCVNKLVVNASAPAAVPCRLYIRVGVDFQLFCPRYGTLTMRKQNGEQSTSEDGGQLDDKEEINFLNFEIEKVTIESASHSLIRNLFGRPWVIGTYTVNAIKKIQLSSPVTSPGSLMNFFAYFEGEVTLTLINDGDACAYAVQTYSYDLVDSFSKMVSFGAVSVPPKSSKIITVPFYSESPLRPVVDLREGTNTSNVLGLLYLYAPTQTSVTVCVSLRNPNFFFILPALHAQNTLAEMEAAVQRDAAISLDPLTGSAWVRDLTADGDVESNPGPSQSKMHNQAPLNACNHTWNKYPSYYVVGRSGSGRSYVANMLVGDTVFVSKLSPVPVTTELQHWDVKRPYPFRVYDTPEKFEIDAPPRAFLYVIDAGRITQETWDHIGWMDKKFPYWRNHCFVLVNHLGSEEIEDFSRGNQQLQNFFASTQGVFKYPCPIMTTLQKQTVDYLGYGMKLVYKDRGAYRHFGVLVDGKVLHTSSENILKSGLSGTMEVVESDPQGWKVISGDYYGRAMEVVLAHACSDLRFSIDNNCETWAKMVAHDTSGTQGGRLKFCLTMVAALGFTYSALAAAESGVTPECISKILTSIGSQFFSALDNEIVRVVVKTVTRIVCYLILYCHSPNLLTTGVLVALLAMDVGSYSVSKPVKKMCESLINGDFEALAKSMLEHVPAEVEIPSFHNQGPKSFNEWTTAAKNVEWWLGNLKKFLDWLRNDLFSMKAESQINAIELELGRISNYCVLADDHIVKCRSQPSYASSAKAKELHCTLVRELGTFLNMEHPPQLRRMMSRVQSLQGRLLSISFEANSSATYRPEPVGVWITGEPGVGKSFMTKIITKDLQSIMGYKLYAQPTGSKHMDGYVDQELHVIDDLGQNRDEEDIKLLCQYMSPVPFIVPKAALESKGTYYNGRVVIATTNKPDFITTSLIDPGALDRRFQYKLRVRPAPRYTTAEGRLNVVRAMEDGAFDTGSCFEVGYGTGGYTHWEPFDRKKFIDGLVNDLKAREKVSDFMNQSGDDLFKSDEPPEKLNVDQTRRQKILEFFSKQISAARGFLVKYQSWFTAMGAVGTIVTLLTLAVKFFKAKMGENEGAYAGPHMRIKDFKIKGLNNQGLNFQPITSRLVELDGHVTALAVGGKQIITFGHVSYTRLTCMQDRYCNEPLEPNRVTYNGQAMDLVVYDVQTQLQFKNINSKILATDYYGDGYIIWKKGPEYFVCPVSDITPMTDFETVEGTKSYQAYSYRANTRVGDCGGVLCGVKNGNLVILGIHVAGNGSWGTSARLFPMFQNQGQVITKKPHEPYHVPRKSGLKPSPCYGMAEVKMEPAVLSRNDPRLEVEIEDMTKHVAGKYIGNTFGPPVEGFLLATSVVNDKLALAVKPCGPLTYEEATSSEILPIDWQTSPGLKYKGRTKSELVNDPKFKEDVLRCLEDPDTTFVTHIKDELRPVEKIKTGNSRAIEASSFDYTIAWRMACGGIVKQLFDKGLTSGFAPGINCYTDFDTLVFESRDNVLCLDFKKFDGSLPPELMRAAVEVLANFSQNWSLVMNINTPTIYSHQLVYDEEWFVSGGMCSGSPATTVVNTICNLLVCYTMLFCSGASPNECHVVAYGDDVVVSCDRQLDVSNWPDRCKRWFGMNVTSSRKDDNLCWVPKYQLEFLKRKPGLFPNSTKIVGVLDIDSMEQHLMWTRGDFDSQLQSFYMELVLHGEVIYDSVQSKIKKKYPAGRHPTFQTMLSVMQPICYQM